MTSEVIIEVRKIRAYLTCFLHINRILLLPFQYISSFLKNSNLWQSSQKFSIFLNTHALTASAIL